MPFPMKILYVHDRPDIQGGALIYANALRRYMEARGHACTLLGFPEGRPLQGENAISIPRKIRNPLTARFFRKLDFDPALFRAARRAIRRIEPEVIHVHNFAQAGNALLAACAAHPTVLTVHDLSICCPLSGRSIDREGRLCNGHFGYACYRRGCFSFRVWLEQGLFRESIKAGFLRRRVAALVVHSRSLARRLEASGLKTVCLPRHVDPDSFPFAPYDRASRRILFVGYLADTKGVARLIEAFQMVNRRIPEATLEIVGDGPEKERYLELAAPEDGRIRFHGEVPHEEVSRFYREAALVAIPSQIQETGPLTALEAMSTGRPVVASNIGGLAEVILDGRTGLLFDPEDVRGLAEGMAWFLDHPERSMKMGAEGRAEIERMSLEDPFGQIEALYRSLAPLRNVRLGGRSW